MRFILGIFLGFILASTLVMADNISSPPPFKDSALYHYLRQIYENLHRLQVVGVNPDGVRSGKRGDMILLQTGGTDYLEINTDSLQTWRGVALSNAP